MKKTIKATIIDLIVALFISAFLIILVSLIFGQRINQVIQTVNQVAIRVDEEAKVNEVSYIKNENKIVNYPEYGTKYADIEIEKIDVNLPVYYGDSMEILKKGVGHSSGSYFPGEGGSIVYMGHNSKKVFRRFSELHIGDRIKVTTNYGEFNYTIYDMQLIYETDIDKIPIQKDKEILMVYTCYPFINFGYTNQRYVVYAEIEGQV